MDGFLATLKEFLRVTFVVLLWFAIVVGFASGVSEMNRGGGGLAGGALVAGTLLYLFGGSSKRRSPRQRKGSEPS